MWNLKYDTNEPIYETETESWTQTCGCQGGRTGSLILGDANCYL